jgi:tripartite-type tricarboxylate transporter receptor subunit TctC
VPTIGETGVPGFEAIVWVGLLAPAGTPRDIVVKLNGEVVRLLRTPEVQASFAAAGVEPVPKSPEAFGAYVRSEFEKWRRVAEESDARVN